MADSTDNLSPVDAPPDSEAGSSDRLVEDVLREAQALLADSVPGGSGSPDSVEPPPPSDAVDLQALVGRVVGLLGDLGQLTAEIDATERPTAAGLDLTMVLPREAPDPENAVPDLGSAGPQVDLFATEVGTTDEADVSSSEAPTSEVVLETVTAASNDASSGAGELVDDLAAALAAEFDQPELVGAASSGSTTSASATSGRSIFNATSTTATEVALMSAMAEEFGVEPRELPPIEDEGDPFASRPETASEPSEAARRLEDLLARRLAEEYDLDAELVGTPPEDVDPETGPPSMAVPAAMPTTMESDADATERVQSDIDAVARAEMEALEALGSDLGSDVHDGATPDPVTPGSSSPDSFSPDSVTPDPRGDDLTTAEADAESSGAAEVDTTAVTDVSEPTSPCGTDADSIVDHETQGRRRPSALVRLGACPFRVLPARFHRHATPVALSLAAWVPLAWGYAILAPKPAPARIDALPAGLHEAAADSPEVHDAPAHRHDVDESLAADASASNDDPH